MTDTHVGESASSFLDNGLVRISSFVGGIIFFTTITWQFAGVFNDIKNGQALLLTKMAALELKVQGAADDRFTRTNMLVWCNTLALVNQDVDFKCESLEKRHQ